MCLGSLRHRVPLERLTLEGEVLFEFELGTVALYSDDGSKQSFNADFTEPFLARHPRGNDHTKVNRFIDFVEGIVFCRLEPARIPAASSADDSELDPSGSNFAAWYRAMVQERTRLVPAFEDRLREVIDGCAGIRLQRVGEEARAVVLRFARDDDTIELSLAELSDGQRVLLILYSLLHLTAGHGQMLLLDEPENYVALAEIQPWLLALSDACGTTIPQSIICSHHPEVIDYLGPEHGLLLEREDAAPTIVRQLVIPGVDGILKLSEVIARGWEL